MSCLDNIPFSAVVGFILILAGSGIMAGTFHEAQSIVAQYMNKFFFTLDSELKFTNIANFSLCGSVALLAFFILVFGCLVTSATKHKVYRDDRCMMGGRCSAAFLMFVVYVAMIVWLVLVLILCVPTLFTLVLDQVCSREKSIHREDGFIYLNLTRYGIYARPWMSEKGLNYRDAITSWDDYKSFCSEFYVVKQYFACSLGGAVCVFNGLMFLLGSLSSYHTKLRLTSELTKYRRDLDYMCQHGGTAGSPEAYPLTGGMPRQMATAPYHHEWNA